MKKIISLALAGLITLTVGVGCKSSDDKMINGKYDISSIVLPDYKSDDHIDFTAYSGPTVENKIGNSHNVNTVTEYHYQKLAEAGFTKVLALYEGGGAAGNADPFQAVRNRSKMATEDALRCLEQAEKVGIKYYVRDWTFYGFCRELAGLGIEFTEENVEKVLSEMFSADNQYINHPAFGGNFAFDEPTYQELDTIAKQVELYQKYVGDKGEPMINLYPSYVTGPSLSTGKYVSYSEYVDKYFELIAPMVGYVSYDFYPFKQDAYTGSSLKAQYLYNLEHMALRCKESRKGDTPIELRTFIQTVGDWTGLRNMTSEGDFRFQIYCALAFGSREIIYYEYANINDASADESWALLNNKDGTYNWTYDCAKNVNNEVKNFEEVYLNFEWDGVMYKNANEMVENKNFTYLTSVMTSHPRIGDFTASEDALLTSFKDKDGNDAFMLVNFTDPHFNKNNEVTIQFKDAKALVMYRLGQKIVVPLGKDGKYTFKLYPGEGRFIIPVK